MTATDLEPSREALGGAGLPRTARRLILAIRPMFLTASILPVLLGTAWGVHVGGRFQPVLFVLALLATALVHAGVNVLNDVYDDACGTDRVNEARVFPFTGGS